VAVVDPDRGVALRDGLVGEIWVHGPNVARRYWRQPDRSAEIFDAVLDEPGLPAGPWLRTGDLGVRHDGDLYITGRLKDLLIVAGRNHYPQDVEETVAGASPALGRVAAFTVTHDDQERVVVVGERAGDGDDPGIVRAARQAVWRRHDLALHDVVLVEPGGVPRTTSGKVSRTGCRARYLAGRGRADA
jgi:acyl-CoA synthetase (AMP-forming)/AMP-acid ligase II